MSGYQSYVICTSPRSGSTLLCKLLAATGKAGNPDSHFHGPSILDWLGYWGLSSENLLSKRDVLRTIFDAARNHGTGDAEIFGLRLQRKSFDFLIQQIDTLHPGHLSDFERFRAAFGDTLFIHLTRNNKLEQAISLTKAYQTGLWHIAPDGTELERLSEPQEPVYDADVIAGHLTELTRLDNDWEDWFSREKINPLRITYNDLSTDPTAVLSRVLGQLGLAQEVAQGINPAVARLADATSQRWVELFLAENETDLRPKT